MAERAALDAGGAVVVARGRVVGVDREAAGACEVVVGGSVVVGSSVVAVDPVNATLPGGGPDL